MAESKNTFIKSKMNQDLDSRLVPNGEYREAFNISISQSEGADVGTLQTVLGNVENIDFSSDDYCNAKINGIFVDEQRKDVYVFITNFTDTTSDKLSGYPPDEATCEIWKRNVETEKTIKLVEGKFLNFSLTHPIENVNIIEDLLFWTDNRNQPRKINVTKANPGEVSSPTYYTNDDQINVAKYYPFEPISLIKDYIVDFTLSGGTPADSEYDEYIDEIVPTSGGSGTGLTVKITAAKTSGPGQGEIEAIEIVDQGNGYQNGDVVDIFPRVGDATLTLVVQTQSTMKDKCTENLPIAQTFTATTPGTLTKNTAFSFSGLPSVPPTTLIGALVTISSASTTPYLARVTAQTATQLTIDWPNATPTSLSTTTSITVGINPDYDANWPGDCEYLKDKFVRFAYRFKFDDNEYSLISPFTQACFIPKQDGFFLKQELTEPDGTSITEYDSDKAYEDTDVEFFENKVTDIEFIIPCPSFLEDGVQNFNNLTEQMHVESIEIIYKDDSEDNLKLLDIITKESFASLESDKLSYSYQSRQPIKVLPEREITRVSDKVPIKALTQEVTGNRVIYGNYVDGYTSVRTLNYEVAAAEKLLLEDTRIEYQNHTLKQNRTYQVGVVLTDRYGRNSDVILSSLDQETSTSDIVFSGSTIFHPYYNEGFSSNNLIRLDNTGWGGDALRVKFNSKIPDNTGQVGYPGLFRGYVIESISNFSSGDGLYTNPGATNVAVTGGTGTGLKVDYVTLKSTAGTSPMVSVTINNPGSGYTLGDLISIPGRIGGTTNASFVYNPALLPNLTGWYSYKIVVKQQEQDYYNVYLPSVINGAVNKSGNASATEASITLFSDNINKVPKDLTDVGPSQTTFNSEVQLSLRVVNVDSIGTGTAWSSVQYYPGRTIEKVVQLSELSNLGVTVSKISSDVTTGATPPAAITMTEYDPNIQSGMAILSVVTSGGSSIITEGDGAYAESYYSDGAGGAELIVAGTTTLIPSGSTITFGPPGVVYNGINNPVIGVLSTSDGIGINLNSSIFKTQLAVAETKPFKSLLDIYYETTSSGLVEDLNNAIEQGITTAIPVRISGIVFDLDESVTGTTVCTNNFYLIDSNNLNIISPSTTGSLVSVFDANQNNRTSEFQLNSQPSGDFNISFVRAAGQGVYIGQDLNDNIFDFTVSLTNNGTTVTNTFTGTVTNEAPVYQGSYDGVNYTLSKRGGGWGGPNPGDVFECFNGSGDTSLRDKEIRWELIEAIPVDGANTVATGNTGDYWPNYDPVTSAWVPSSVQTDPRILILIGNHIKY